MTRISPRIVLSLLVLLVCSTVFAQSDAIVMINGSGISPSFKAAVARLGGSIVSSHEGAGIAVVSGLSDRALAQLGKEKSVGVAMRDVEAQVVPNYSDVSAEEAFVGEESQSAPQTAFFFPRQWHLRAISADQAWAAGYLGSPDVTVAILDTGISYIVPDLVGRVDLTRSKSFVASDDALVAAYFPGMHPITDLHYHGTHVAATVSSNALVGAGVTSNTTLFGVKVLDVYGRGTFSNTINGVLYAADQGADVINMSLGGGFEKAGNGQAVSLINRIMNYAYRQGTLVVVSAGNDGLDLDHDGNLYKTYCTAPNVVCVSATGPTNYSVNGPWANIDAPAYYTNFGRSAISVAAPGGNESYVYEACSKTSLQIPICRTGNFILGLAGTSMASPHAAGVAALITSIVGPNNPAQVRAILEQTADDLGQPGTDPFYGKGRVSAKHAVGLW